jgi:hypothetical protein
MRVMFELSGDRRTYYDRDIRDDRERFSEV